jgi:nitroreductase
MDIKEVIRKRHSVRSFSNKEFSEKIIEELLVYANLAPSAGNLQAREFIIIKDGEIKEKLSSAAFNQEFICEAPYNIIVCANLQRISPYGFRGTELYCIQDTAAAIEHILLLAVNQGLGACWVGAFDEKSVSEILHLPSYVRPVAIIPIGFPNEQNSPTPQRNYSSLIHVDRW